MTRFKQHHPSHGGRPLSLQHIVGGWIDGTMSQASVDRELHSLAEMQMSQFYETPEHLQSLRLYRNLTEIQVQEAVLHAIIQSAESEPDDPTARRSFLHGVLDDLPYAPAIRELALESARGAWTSKVTRKESRIDSGLENGLRDWATGQVSSADFIKSMHLSDSRSIADSVVEKQAADGGAQHEVAVKQALFYAQQVVMTAAVLFCDHKGTEDSTTRQAVSQSLIHQILDSPSRSR